MSDQTVMLQLSFPGEPPTTATATVHEWTMLERVRRAVMGLGLMWGLAGVTTLFPFLARFTVPAFLLLGPVVAIFQFTETRRLKSMKGSCPRCKHEREHQLEVRFNGPRTITCDECRNLIEIRLSTNDSPAK